MKSARTLAGIAAVTATFAGALFLHGTPAHGLAFQSTPAVVARPGTEISDVYLFPSPTNANNVVAVMDVNPGITSGAGALNTYFDQSVLYTMKFDRKYPNNGEAAGSGPIEDLVLQFSVGQPGNNSQAILFYGAGAPNQTGTTTTLIDGGSAVAVGQINTSFSGGSGITIFAGVRANPYFADQAQYDKLFPSYGTSATSNGCLPTFGDGTCPQGFNNPGSNFYGTSNVLSIVVEMPRALLTNAAGSLGTVAYWATTSTTSGN